MTKLPSEIKDQVYKPREDEDKVLRVNFNYEPPFDEGSPE